MKHSNVSLIFEKKNALCPFACIWQSDVMCICWHTVQTGVRYYYYICFSSLTLWTRYLSHQILTLAGSVKMHIRCYLLFFFLSFFFLTKQILYSRHSDINSTQFTYGKKHSDVCDCERNEYFFIIFWPLMKNWWINDTYQMNVILCLLWMKVH